MLTFLCVQITGAGHAPGADVYTGAWANVSLLSLFAYADICKAVLADVFCLVSSR